ncbi:MAG: leucine-rich repeat domain-containing protein, partial [Chryseobacterium sp.]
TELPESFRQLSTKLNTLNISHNKLKELPALFGQLQKLKSLDLSHNKLETLPDDFRYLFALANLNLSSNRLSNNGIFKFLLALQQKGRSNTLLTKNEIDFIRGLKDLEAQNLNLSDNTPAKTGWW